MAGVTNTGIANYVSNPSIVFPKNSITIDIFGNVFYRDYTFGACGDVGVYWSDEKNYSRYAMLFFAISMKKALLGKYYFGNKLRSSRSHDLTMRLPEKNGDIDFAFMENFMLELETERIKELKEYTHATGLIIENFIILHKLSILHP